MVFYLRSVGGFFVGRYFFAVDVALVLVVVWHYILAGCIVAVSLRSAMVSVLGSSVGIFAAHVVNISVAGSRRNLIQTSGSPSRGAQTRTNTDTR